jgi:hypothetical protein
MTRQATNFLILKVIFDLIMKSIIIHPRDKKELLFVNLMLRRLRITFRQFDLEAMEDFGLEKMMKQSDRSKKVSKQIILKSLS